MKEFAIRLKELRTENNLSAMTLGKKIGVSDVAILNWENGINEPKASFIIKLALYFNVSTDYLLGLSDF